MDLERGCVQKSVFEMLFLPVLPFLNSFRILLFQPFFQLFSGAVPAVLGLPDARQGFFLQLATALFQKMKDQFPVGS